MPVVTVVRDRLFEEIGKTYDTTEDFEKLCFEFGVELDGESTEQVNFRKTDGAEETKEEVSYKIEVCANRYDLLCLEGLSLSLGVFLGNKAFPDYRVVPPASGSLERMVVKPETKQIRPFVVAAILRNITFTQESYNSFIDLQDKLHENICRRRTLVAIGTHDYDTIEGPFTYEARAPKDIKFKPLNQTQEFDAEALMKHYESDLKLKRFLHIIRSSPVYPVIYDSKGVVLSMPPIINGDHSKIKLETKNVFIECTATDLTKAQIVLDTVLAMFSKYCADPYTVEQVQIEMPDGEKQVEPNWPRVGSAVSVDPAYVNRVVGIDISAEKQAELLTKMCLESKVVDGKLDVKVPITRSDVLHPCDVVEDVAIAYGYNNIKRTIPKTQTVAVQQPVGKLTDLLRFEMAQAGYVECLNFGLCSTDENFGWLNRPNDGKTAVTLANPKTVEFQLVRTTLLPGVLKSLHHNKAAPLPIKLFEVSDVVFQDPQDDVGARNERHLVAMYSGTTTGFELIHGVMDLIMTKLGMGWLDHDEESKRPKDPVKGYRIQESKDGVFFPGRGADILRGDGLQLGVMGVISPDVLEKFDVVSPTSFLELNVMPFL